MAKKPANDNERAWTPGVDYSFRCSCGSDRFWIKRGHATGFNHVLCAKCDTDHSMKVIDK